MLNFVIDRSIFNVAHGCVNGPFSSTDSMAYIIRDSERPSARDEYKILSWPKVTVTHAVSRTV